MKCPYCNYDIKPGDRYCENCGASAVTEPEPTTDMYRQSGNPYYPQNTNTASGYGNSQNGGYNQYGGGYNQNGGYNQYGGSNSQYGYGNNQYGSNNAQYGGNPQYSSYDQYSSYNHSSGSPQYVGFGEAIKLFFVNYVNFRGRSTRSEFWFAYLFQFLVRFGVSFFSTFFSSLFFISSSSTASLAGGARFTRAVVSLVNLALLLPALSVGVRRLHDTGKSGWWILLEFTIYLLIPISVIAALFSRSIMSVEVFLLLVITLLLASLAGLIVLIIMWCRASDGVNKWGAPADPFRK